MSTKDAYGYVIHLYNSWVKQQNSQKNKNAPPQFNSNPYNSQFRQDQSGLNSLGQQAAAVGFSNLVQIQQQIYEEVQSQHISFETSGYLLQMLSIAIRASAKDTDLPQIIELADTNAAYIVLISERKDWWNRPEVIQFVKRKLTETKTFAPSPFDMLMETGQWPPSSKNSAPKPPPAQGLLLTIALESADPSLQEVVNKTLQNVLQNSDIDSSLVNLLLQQCFKNPDKYSAVLPGLINLYNVQEDNGRHSSNMSSELVECLSKAHKLCLDSQLQKASLDLIAFYQKKHPTFPYNQNNQDAIEALFGNLDSLQRVVQHYLADENKYHGSEHLGVDISVLESIAYQGQGNRNQGIFDNVSLAKFDTTTGQWSITPPPNYRNNP